MAQRIDAFVEIFEAGLRLNAATAFAGKCLAELFGVQRTPFIHCPVLFGWQKTPNSRDEYLIKMQAPRVHQEIDA